MMEAGGPNRDGFSGRALKSFRQGNDVMYSYTIRLFVVCA